MPRSLATLVRFKRDETGVTAVEYGLIVALIATVLLAAVGALGTGLSAEFIDLANRVSAANAAK